MDKQTTLGGFLDKWIETVIKNNVRYSTYVAYRGYIENHIKRFIGGNALSEIKPPVIQDFVRKLTEEKRLGARTIGIVVGMLSNAFGYAEDCELVIRNPCRRIRLPKVEEEEVTVFGDREQTRIEKAVLNSDDSRCFGVLLSLYTGIRIGELCALRWNNIDFENKCMRIRKSLNRIPCDDGSGRKTVMTESDPKTKKSKRIIQLPDFLIKILRKLKKESNSEYVFSMKNGKFVHPRTMQNLHKRLLERAGVPYGNFHVLRHTFATRAAELNTDPKTISETLGHTNTMITLNRYTHSLKEQKQKMTKGLNGYFKDKKIATLF